MINVNRTARKGSLNADPLSGVIFVFALSELPRDTRMRCLYGKTLYLFIFFCYWKLHSRREQCLLLWGFKNGTSTSQCVVKHWSHLKQPQVCTKNACKEAYKLASSAKVRERCVVNSLLDFHSQAFWKKSMGRNDRVQSNFQIPQTCQSSDLLYELLYICQRKYCLQANGFPDRQQSVAGVAGFLHE